MFLICISIFRGTIILGMICYAIIAYIEVSFVSHIATLVLSPGSQTDKFFILVKKVLSANNNNDAGVLKLSTFSWPRP